MSNDEKIPEDLGIKIGSKEEKLWTDILRNAKEVLRQAEEQIIVQNAIIELAQTKIEAEKQKV